jgi:hypothetical protein
VYIIAIAFRATKSVNTLDSIELSKLKLILSDDNTNTSKTKDNYVYTVTTISERNQNLNTIDKNDQIIIFNIGNDGYNNKINPKSSSLSFLNSYEQKFESDKINYCNFDPLLLNKKNKRKNVIKNDNLVAKNSNLNVNIFLKGDIFNETSQITGKYIY